MIAAAVLLALAFALGYTAGRIRPYAALVDAAHSRVVGWRSTRHLTAWALTWCVVCPGMAFHAWRHRNDPPPEPVTVNPDFFRGASDV